MSLKTHLVLRASDVSSLALLGVAALFEGYAATAVAADEEELLYCALLRRCATVASPVGIVGGMGAMIQSGAHG